MTNGPLPPHERPWRHPSELPAAPLEPPTRSGRMLIVSTATVGLVLVGVLMFVMTPGRSDAPVARLDSTLVAVGAVEAVTVGGSAIATTIAGATGVVTSPAVGRTVTTTPSSPVAVTSAPGAVPVSTSAAMPPVATAAPATSAAPSVDRSAPAATMLVTPIGEGLAVTTHAAMGLSASFVADEEVTPVAAALPSGSPVEVDIVAIDGDVVVVSILSGATTEDRTLAEESVALDGDSTYVVVDGTTARFDAAIYPPPHLPEAAPIVDDEGRLLALCTLGPAGIELVTVSAIPTVAPPSTPAPAPDESGPAASASLPESTESTEPTEPTTATTLPTTTTDPATTTTTTTTAAEAVSPTSQP